MEDDNDPPTRLEAQAKYSATCRDKIARSGAPQRDHVAAAVLHVVLEHWNQRCPASNRILGQALSLLVSDGYLREPTKARMKGMARQPRRMLKPPKPKT